MAVDLQTASSITPAAAPVNSLDPLSGAGVMLTKYVLAILSAVLFLLFCALIYQEKRFSDLTTEAYRVSIERLSSPDSRTKKAGGIDSALAALRLLEKNSDLAKADTLQHDATAKIKALRSSDFEQSNAVIIDDIQSKADQLSVTGGSKEARPDKEKVKTLIYQLERIEASLSPETAESLKARQELLKSFAEATNSTREFWSKIAQMILLNLLLPVLTALLGYVFASKQSAK